MQGLNRSHTEKAFDAYVAGYDAADEKIRLKAEHTYKVAALCDMIAASLGLPEAERDVAWLAGMLHDIGRFEQVRRWDTFYDSQSVNHAEFGADLLFRDGLIGRFVGEGAVDPALEQDEGAAPCLVDPALEPAIRNHNRLRVEDGLLARTRMFADILRDADKIDIIRVNVESPGTEIYNVPLEEIRASAISPEVEAGFYRHRCIDSRLKRTVADRMVGHFAFVFELVYPAAKAEVKRQGHLWQAMGFEFTNPETAAKVAAMRDEMRAWLGE